MFKALFLDIMLSIYYTFCCCMFIVGAAEVLLSNGSYGDGFIFWFHIVGYTLMSITCGIAATFCVITTYRDAKEYKKNK